jgi:signal transduction histidine kinase
VRAWIASHRERLGYALAAVLLVVALGAWATGGVLLRHSAEGQRQTLRLHELGYAASRLDREQLAADYRRVRAHDGAAARRLGASYSAVLAGGGPAARGRFEAAVDAEIERLARVARDTFPVARVVLIAAAVASLLLVATLIWLFEVQRRAGRIDRDNARLREEFVGVVSHELRTPLTSILGYIEMIREDARGLGADQQAYFDIVKRNANRLLSLVGDLLLVAAADDGSLRLDLQEIDFETLVRESVAAARVAADRKGISLTLSAAPAPLHGDPLRLAQMLDNVVSNAIKFTPDGGRVAVTATVHDDVVLLEVQDSGVGIAPADRERIFERFFRARATTQDTVTGAGLGLAITKAIVEAHGGTIGVESRVGEGTSFRILLPAAPSAVPALV